MSEEEGYQVGERPEEEREETVENTLGNGGMAVGGGETAGGRRGTFAGYVDVSVGTGASAEDDNGGEGGRMDVSEQKSVWHRGCR